MVSRPAVIVLLLASVSVVGPAWGQEADDPLAGRDAATGVFVRDSATVREKLTLARRMERLREWDNAADVYQELLRDWAGTVVPSATNADGEITQYQSVTAAVVGAVAAWPAEGLAVYRELYEPEARRLLDEARDLGLSPAARRGLRRVTGDYFVTNAAAEAAVLLADLELEAGQPAAAAQVAGRFLDAHPDLGDRRPELLLRATLASRLAGDDRAAAERATELAENHADVTGTVAGEQVVLADAARDLLDIDPVTGGDVGDTNDWPVAFGADDRHRVPAQDPVAGASQYFNVELPRRFPDRVNRRVLQTLNQTHPAATGESLPTLLPAAADGVLYVNDNAAVYALNLVGGRPAAGWARTYGGGTFSVEAWSQPEDSPAGLCVTDRNVLAIVGKRDPAAESQVGRAGNDAHQLVCLDRVDGRRIWSLTHTALGGLLADDGQAADRPNDRRGAGTRLMFTGTPVAADGLVFVTVSLDRGGQFTDRYVVAVDEATGEVAWRTFLVSGIDADRTRRFNRNNAADGSSESHLALDAGTLFVSTDRGAVAAVDAASGMLRWLTLYERPQPENRRGRIRRNVRDARFANPVIVTQGSVFVLPPDAPAVLRFDAATGELAQRIDTARHDAAEVLAGVVGEKLLLVSDDVLHCLNWRTYDAAQDPEAEANLVWLATFEAGRGRAERLLGIQGFPLVTENAVYVPTLAGIYRVGMRSGAREDFYNDPAGGSVWEDGQGPGNLSLVAGQLVVASFEGVTVFADPATIAEQLEAEIARQPGDVAPRLRFAEALASSGDAAGVIAQLREAAGVAGDDEAKRQVFDAALALAGRTDTDAAYDLARTLADTPERFVQLTLLQAEDARDPKRRIELYQSVLIDPDRRAVRVAAGPAGEVAEARIADAVAEGGAGLYADIERRAAAALVAAGDDPAALARVAEVFPNADAAAVALGRAADAYEAAGELPAARRVLRDALGRMADPADQADAYERLARLADRDAGWYDVVTGRLTRAVRLAPDARLAAPLTPPGGEPIADVTRVEALVEVRRRATAIAAGALPTLDLPDLAAGGDTFAEPITVEGVDRLLAGRRGVLATWGKEAGLRLIDAAGGVVAQAPAADEPAVAEFAGGGLLVRGETTLALHDAETLEPVWAAAPFVEAGGGDGRAERRALRLDEEVVSAHAWAPGVALAMAADGRLVALDAASGREAWRREPEPMSRGTKLLASPDYAVTAVTLPSGATRVTARDLADGREVFARELPQGNERLVNLTLTPEGLLVIVEPARVVGYDLSVGGDAAAPTEAFVATTPASDGRLPFNGSGGDGHVAVAAGRVLVLADANTPEQRVWAFEAETGEPVRFEPGGPAASFYPGTARGDLRIVPSGARFWIVAGGAFVAHDLDRPGLSWEGSPFGGTPLYYDALATRGRALLLHQAARNPNGRSSRPTELVLHVHDRLAPDADTGGLLTHEVILQDRRGLVPGEWRVIDGAFAYRTRDGRLILLRPAGQDGEAGDE